MAKFRAIDRDFGMRTLLDWLTSFNLSLKLMIPVVFVLLTATGFIIAVVRAQNSQVSEERERRAIRFTQVAHRITESELARNRFTFLPELFRALKEKGRMDRIRLLGLEGQVVISTEEGEKGTVIGKDRIGCAECHTPGRPPVADPFVKFTYRNESGRILGIAYPLMNGPSCSAGGCHPPSSEQKALGVVEVELSMARMDDRIAESNREILFAAAIALLGVLGVIGAFIHWAVHNPLKRLHLGIKRVQAGDLDAKIPIFFEDEIGDFAKSFNKMIINLKDAKEGGIQKAQALEKKIDELKSTQIQLVRSEKLASLGKLSAGVAHEINNPLATVLNYCYLIKRRAGENGIDNDKIDIMIQEITRCSGIVRGLLDFAREDEPNKEPTDLNSVLTQTLDLVSNQSLFHDIHIGKTLSPDLPQVMADSSQIKQVFMNIVINAAEAMPEGGDLKIETRRMGEFVETLFRDTGVGIPPKDITRIFDPFFSSKKGGHGTGLGLAVSFSIIERHGGEIEVESTPGEGTLFSIRLPA